ncbi:MAG TPA: hypothetical protein VFW33_05315, partial [Gemmataceae bacterium]|nr:hypothetical protein [Gemmataceae bacterium]
RLGNLRALREAAYLLWEDAGRTRLRCDWCEVMAPPACSPSTCWNAKACWRRAASSASTSTPRALAPSAGAART